MGRLGDRIKRTILGLWDVYLVIVFGALVIGLVVFCGCQQPPSQESPDAGVCYVPDENGTDPCDRSISLPELQRWTEGLTECVILCCGEGVTAERRREVCPPN